MSKRPKKIDRKEKRTIDQKAESSVWPKKSNVTFRRKQKRRIWVELVDLRSHRAHSSPLFRSI